MHVYGNGSLVPQQGASALPRGLVQAVLVNQSQSRITGQEPEKTLSLDNAGWGLPSTTSRTRKFGVWDFPPLYLRIFAICNVICYASYM